MPQRSARSIRGGDALVRAFALVALTAVILLPRLALAAPDPLNVLLVANGYYTQENDIEDHLLDLGHSVTRLKDYKLKGTTSLVKDGSPEPCDK